MINYGKYEKDQLSSIKWMGYPIEDKASDIEYGRWN